jgi:tetratricopeptide (TPR) repeat protein
MATRSTLEPKVAAAGSAADLFALARECFEAPADMAYAKDILTSAAFTGAADARAALDKVAGDAMFTKDFVTLAIGYQALGDAAKAGEMLSQGADFAMDGSEKVAVGMGYWLALGDAAAAGKALAGALKEVSATEELYGLAGVVAELNNAELFAQIVDKIKAKAGRAGDFARLAKLVASNGDKAKAVEIIHEAAGKYGSPADLIALSGAMGEIDPAAAGALYDKALDSAKDFTALMQVLAAAAGNAEFTRAVLSKAGTVATASGELIQLADAYAAIGDAKGVSDMLDKAEESVANLDEMRKVVEAVNKHAAGDAARVARVAEKLAKREANQAKYVEIQNEEAKCTTTKQIIALADRILAELDDKSYAAKMLGIAEAQLREDGFHFGRFKPLILAVDRLGDKAWLGRLLDESVASTGDDFVWFREIVLACARELKDAEFGKARAKAYMDGRALGDNPYDYTKMAELAVEGLGDTALAAKLLSEAAKHAKDHFALAYVGKLYRDIGETAQANALFAKAVAACPSGDACVQLASRLRSYALPVSEIEPLMDQCNTHLTRNDDKLRWAEGVADLLLDPAWAAKAYAAIAPSFRDGAEKKRFELSHELRMGYRFYGPGVKAH